MVPNLATTNVAVNYSGFGLNQGTVTVSITNYQFQFVVPIVGTTITMPATQPRSRVRAWGLFRSTCKDLTRRSRNVSRDNSKDDNLKFRNHCRAAP